MIEMNELLQRIVDADLKKGTKVLVEVKDVLGKDFVALHVEVCGDKAALTKMMLVAMAHNNILHGLIRVSSAASENVEVDAANLPNIYKVLKGGEA